MLCGLPGSCCGLTVLLFKGLICKVPEIPANFQFFLAAGFQFRAEIAVSSR